MTEETRVDYLLRRQKECKITWEEYRELQRMKDPNWRPQTIMDVLSPEDAEEYENMLRVISKQIAEEGIEHFKFEESSETNNKEK